MKTSNQLRTGLLAITVVAVTALASCGGGGASVTTPSFDSSEFHGSWKYTDGHASGNPAGCVRLNGNNFNYGSLKRPNVVSATTMTVTREVYSDMTCTTYLGLVELTLSLTWSAGNVAGKTNVARVVGTTTGYALRRDGAPGFTLNNIPPMGMSAKVLVDVQGALLYASDDTSPLDADGYPTVLQTSAFSTR